LRCREPLRPVRGRAPAAHPRRADRRRRRPLPPCMQVYSLDGWDTPASTVSWLRSQGAYPVCYISAGSYEDWRPDASQFLASDRGSALQGWAGEAWLDVRSANVRAIMTKVGGGARGRGGAARGARRRERELARRGGGNASAPPPRRCPPSPARPNGDPSPRPTPRAPGPPRRPLLRPTNSACRCAKTKASSPSTATT
jgi:hypothetical protein